MKYTKQQKIIIETLKKAADENWSIWEWLGWYLSELKLYLPNDEVNQLIDKLSENSAKLYHR